jgi:hypothetical protein
MPLGVDAQNGGATRSVNVRGWNIGEKHYSVGQSPRHNTWKWSVDVNGRVKSGKALIREVGIQLAERVIDRALATKKKRRVPPGTLTRTCKRNGPPARGRAQAVFTLLCQTGGPALIVS